MAKDLIKEGMTFALGIVKISGEQFNKVVKGLERKNQVSSKEGKKMVQAWVGQQLKQMQKMKIKLKKEALKTRLYTSRDIAGFNKVIKNLSNEIAKLQTKKKKTESVTRKKKKKALKKRTAKKKPAKGKAKKETAKRKPAKKKAKKKTTKKRKTAKRKKRR